MILMVEFTGCQPALHGS